MSLLLEVEQLSVRYAARGRVAASLAVDGASFQLSAGEIMGLAGESGCGKSSLARALLGLVPMASGSMRWRGQRLQPLARRGGQHWRRELQMVFQDPVASLDPRMTVGESIAEPLRALLPELDTAARQARVVERLIEVGLGGADQHRYPHQFSGGQLQRVAIARALVVDPQLLVCDEVVSALDVSVQGQIVNLLADLRARRGLALLFISHNLAVLAQLCDSILVMHRGRIVETTTREQLLTSPQHACTRALCDAVLPRARS